MSQKLDHKHIYKLLLDYHGYAQNPWLDAIAVDIMDMVEAERTKWEALHQKLVLTSGAGYENLLLENKSLENDLEEADTVYIDIEKDRNEWRKVAEGYLEANLQLRNELLGHKYEHTGVIHSFVPNMDEVVRQEQSLRLTNDELKEARAYAASLEDVKVAFKIYDLLEHIHTLDTQVRLLIEEREGFESAANGWKRLDQFFKENKDHPIFEEVERELIRDQCYSAPIIYTSIIEKLIEEIESWKATCEVLEDGSGVEALTAQIQMLEDSKAEQDEELKELQKWLDHERELNEKLVEQYQEIRRLLQAYVDTRSLRSNNL